MPVQDNREPEAPSRGNIIEALNEPRDRIPPGCERRVTTRQGPLPEPCRVSTASCEMGPAPVSLLLCPWLELDNRAPVKWRGLAQEPERAWILGDETISGTALPH